MRCPKCGFHNVDWAEECKKCSGPLIPKFRIKFASGTQEKPRPKKQPRKERPGPPAVPGEEQAREEQVHEQVPEQEPIDISASLPSGPPSEEIEYIQTPSPDIDSSEEEIPASLPPSPNEIADEISSKSEEIEESYEQSPLEGEANEDFDEFDDLRDLEGYDEIVDEGQYDSFALAAPTSRFAAYLIDILILGIISVFTVYAAFMIAEKSWDMSVATPYGIKVFILAYVLYFIVLTAHTGQTLGKKLLRLQVVAQSGENIGLKAAVIRLIVNLILIGSIWAFIDSNRQTWHDKVAKTFVVNV